MNGRIEREAILLASHRPEGLVEALHKSRPVMFGAALLATVVLWPVLMLGVAFWRGWRIESITVIDEDELRKAGL